MLALHGNTLRCLPKGNTFVWKVFTNLVCFTGDHLTFAIIAFVAAFCQIVIKAFHDITYYDSDIRSASMFAKFIFISLLFLGEHAKMILLNLCCFVLFRFLYFLLTVLITLFLLFAMIV